MNKNVLAMYADYLANWLTAGKLINQDSISSLGLKCVFDRYLTKGHITKVWCITGIPVHYSRNISEGIRLQMHKYSPNVKTIIYTHSTPVNIPINNRTFLMQLNSAVSHYNDYAEAYAQLTEEQKTTGFKQLLGNGRTFAVTKEGLQDLADKKDSYMYSYSETTKGSAFCETYLFIQATAPDKRSLKQYVKRLNGILSYEKINFVELKGTVSEFLNNFGPAVHKRENVRTVSPLLFSEENFAAQMPYRSKGLVSEGGLLIAMDWLAKMPFYYNPFESSAAQVNLILSKSGQGKTYLAFGIADEGNNYGVHSSAIDIKGNEWIKLSPFMKTKVISCNGKERKFVNTLRIDDMPVNDKNCKEVYDNAVKATILIMTLMTQLSSLEGNPVDLESILRQAVMKYYYQQGIYRDNGKTFIHSKNMTYKELLPIIDDLKATASFNENQKNICDLIRVRCATFVMAGGAYGDLMQNEVTVGEILETPLVVYSFNKNADGEMDIMDTIQVAMIQYLDSKKHEIRKEQGLHTMAFYEEIQRCINAEAIINYITSRVTGSRSSNLTVFLLLNAVSALNESSLKQIRSNITTVIIGKVNEKDIDVLVNDYECGPIEQYLRDINDDQKATMYRNCFAIKYDTGLHTDKAIIKAMYPPEVFKQFNTRDRMDL